MANIKKTCLIHQQQGIGDLIFIQKIIKKYVENDMDFSDWQDYVPTKRNYAAELALWDHLGLERNTKYTLINEFRRADIARRAKRKRDSAQP